MKYLVLAPHPDDESIGCGGTILSLTEREHQVDVCFVTGESPRVEEAEVACNILGVSNKFFLHMTDGAVDVTPELFEQLKTFGEEYDIILCPNIMEAHRDHAKVAEAAMKAIDNKKLIFYEIWTPLIRPNVYRNITTYLSLKIQAIQAHKSQMALESLDQMILALNRYRGITSGSHAYMCEAFYAEVPQT